MDTIEVYFEADMTKCLDKKEAPRNKSNQSFLVFSIEIEGQGGLQGACVQYLPRARSAVT